MLAIGIVVAIAGNPPPGASILWAPLAAIFGTIGLASFFRGMAVGSISVVAPIAAVAAVVPVVFGIATGDDVSLGPARRLRIRARRGGARVVRAARGRLGEGRGRSSRALAAVIGFGGYYVPMHEASGEDFLWAAFTFRLSVFVLVLAAWLVFRPPLGAAREASSRLR